MACRLFRLLVFSLLFSGRGSPSNTNIAFTRLILRQHSINSIRYCHAVCWQFLYLCNMNVPSTARVLPESLFRHTVKSSTPELLSNSFSPLIPIFTETFLLPERKSSFFSSCVLKNMESFLYGFGLAFGTVWASLRMFSPSKSPEKNTSQHVSPVESKGEAACREAAFKLTGRKFIKVRPRELMNPETGKTLELDCYCPELKLAIEYQGKQHYEYVPIFHRSGRSDLKSQHARDCAKRLLCHKAGIRLIEVPYTVTDIYAYLKTALYI
ncbi:unknown [Singapore grouper iridovirus]|uniref:Uvr/REP helicase n=1 Tax=Singapore grouper iridovirus TaxID=262968 RepID=Q5YFG7_9VIRU|nr:hypothetical protein ORF098R [Singapore grouper iridovirus]AAS18113.1 unknown [Singapore grouper iridovirus]WAU86807.1 hypothetical protein ORF098R [Singapore grouper iridovirus]